MKFIHQYISYSFCILKSSFHQPPSVFLCVARFTLLARERLKKYCATTEDHQGHLWQWINNHTYRKIALQATVDL